MYVSKRLLLEIYKKRSARHVSRRRRCPFVGIKFEFTLKTPCIPAGVTGPSNSRKCVPTCTLVSLCRCTSVFKGTIYRKFTGESVYLPFIWTFDKTQQCSPTELLRNTARLLAVFLFTIQQTSFALRIRFADKSPDVFESFSRVEPTRTSVIRQVEPLNYTKFVAEGKKRKVTVRNNESFLFTCTIQLHLNCVIYVSLRLLVTSVVDKVETVVPSAGNCHDLAGIACLNLYPRWCTPCNCGWIMALEKQQAIVGGNCSRLLWQTSKWGYILACEFEDVETHTDRSEFREVEYNIEKLIVYPLVNSQV